MVRVVITAINDTKNAAYKTLLFMQEVTEKKELTLTAFQRANGQEAKTLDNSRKNAASELVTAEVAAKFAVGEVLEGWFIQGYRSATPFRYHNGQLQQPVANAKSNPYYEGAMVEAQPGAAVPEELVVTMESHPDLYSFQQADGKTVRGLQAVRQLKEALTQSTATSGAFAAATGNIPAAAPATAPKVEEKAPF